MEPPHLQGSVGLGQYHEPAGRGPQGRTVWPPPRRQTRLARLGTPDHGIDQGKTQYPASQSRSTYPTSYTRPYIARGSHVDSSSLSARLFAAARRGRERVGMYSGTLAPADGAGGDATVGHSLQYAPLEALLAGDRSATYQLLSTSKSMPIDGVSSPRLARPPASHPASRQRPQLGPSWRGASSAVGSPPHSDTIGSNGYPLNGSIVGLPHAESHTHTARHGQRPSPHVSPNERLSAGRSRGKPSATPLFGSSSLQAAADLAPSYYQPAASDPEDVLFPSPACSLDDVLGELVLGTSTHARAASLAASTAGAGAATAPSSDSLDHGMGAPGSPAASRSQRGREAGYSPSQAPQQDTGERMLRTSRADLVRDAEEDTGMFPITVRLSLFGCRQRERKSRLHRADLDELRLVAGAHFGHMLPRGSGGQSGMGQSRDGLQKKQQQQQSSWAASVSSMGLFSDRTDRDTVSVEGTKPRLEVRTAALHELQSVSDAQLGGNCRDGDRDGAFEQGGVSGHAPGMALMQASRGPLLQSSEDLAAYLSAWYRRRADDLASDRMQVLSSAPLVVVTLPRAAALVAARLRRGESGEGGDWVGDGASSTDGWVFEALAAPRGSGVASGRVGSMALTPARLVSRAPSRATSPGRLFGDAARSLGSSGSVASVKSGSTAGDDEGLVGSKRRGRAGEDGGLYAAGLGSGGRSTGAPAELDAEEVVVRLKKRGADSGGRGGTQTMDGLQRGSSRRGLLSPKSVASMLERKRRTTEPRVDGRSGQEHDVDSVKYLGDSDWLHGIGASEVDEGVGMSQAKGKGVEYSETRHGADLSSGTGEGGSLCSGAGKGSTVYPESATARPDKELSPSDEQATARPISRNGQNHHMEQARQVNSKTGSEQGGGVARSRPPLRAPVRKYESPAITPDSTPASSRAASPKRPPGKPPVQRAGTASASMSTGAHSVPTRSRNRSRAESRDSTSTTGPMLAEPLGQLPSSGHKDQQASPRDGLKNMSEAAAAPSRVTESVAVPPHRRSRPASGRASPARSSPSASGVSSRATSPGAGQRVAGSEHGSRGSSGGKSAGRHISEAEDKSLDEASSAGGPPKPSPRYRVLLKLSPHAARKVASFRSKQPGALPRDEQAPTRASLPPHAAGRPVPTPSQRAANRHTGKPRPQGSWNPGVAPESGGSSSGTSGQGAQRASPGRLHMAAQVATSRAEEAARAWRESRARAAAASQDGSGAHAHAQRGLMPMGSSPAERLLRRGGMPPHMGRSAGGLAGISPFASHRALPVHDSFVPEGQGLDAPHRRQEY